MQENKFKVGDKVKYAGTTSYDDLKEGDIRVVTHLQKYEGSDEIYGVNLEGVTGHVPPETLSFVECFTVEEVIEAFANVYNEKFDNKHVVDEVKQELEKRKNPEYLKYLELKEKFEPSVF